MHANTMTSLGDGISAPSNGGGSAERGGGVAAGVTSFIQRIGEHTAFLLRRKAEVAAPPTLSGAERFPYGPFRFRTQVANGAHYTVFSSTDLKTWGILGQGIAKEESVEYVDSEAYKFSHRFYRVQSGGLDSTNVIGYASVPLPPGYSMIANPFQGTQKVGESFKSWPNGTTLSRFDVSLFKFAENVVKGGRWTRPHERLSHGEGGIFFNPTTDYKAVSFVGEVVQGQMSVPVPSGFSVRSALVPQPGDLVEDLGFPIGNGDVIHLFDRDRQKYELYPYEDGKWLSGAPVVGVGESFWVAKAEAGNWVCELSV